MRRATSIPERLFALSTMTAHAQANRGLVRIVRERARRSKVRLHEGQFDSFFVEPLDLWLVAHRLPNRYRNAFGPGDPVGKRNLWPSIQLNLALAPGSAKPRARFLRDAGGEIWLAHSGILGGRQPGISREGFLRALGGARQVTVDDTVEELVVLGTLANPEPLLDELARITHTASAYRDALASGLR